MRAGIRDQGSGIRVILLLAVVLTSQVALAAQHDHTAPANANRAPGTVAPIPDPRSPIPVNLGWEPIRCWRQASAGAIAIGETFSVVVTCAVYEADNAQVIPDESRLNVASIQMAPFEILGGSHPPDVHRGSRRFFSTTISCASSAGRDRPRRQHSAAGDLVSHSQPRRRGGDARRPRSVVRDADDADQGAVAGAERRVDIRDASEASLGAVESLRFRSSLFRVLTLAFGALGRGDGGARAGAAGALEDDAATTERDRIPDRAILESAAADLAAVQSASAARDGPTRPWRARSHRRAWLRAAAIDQPISQKVLAHAARARWPAARRARAVCARRGHVSSR
jgi:hypothetical protein